MSNPQATKAAQAAKALQQAAAPTKERGKVEWFNDAKGFGFILRSDAITSLFVHWSEIINQDGYKSLSKDDVVEFFVKRTPKGPSAIEVEVVE